MKLPSARRAIAVLALGLACLGTSGCAFGGGGVMMTPQLIADGGTQVFKAPYDKVFTATVNALKSEGFPIAMAEPDKGLIKTGQKLIRSVAVGGNGAAVGVDITRQYVLHVGNVPGGVAVAAQPRIFQGNAELSDGPIWDVESPQGERALWRRLFRDIQEAL